MTIVQHDRQHRQHRLRVSPSAHTRRSTAMADKATPALERARTNVHNTIDKVADGAACGVDWAAENTRCSRRSRPSSRTSRAATCASVRWSRSPARWRSVTWSVA